MLGPGVTCPQMSVGWFVLSGIQNTIKKNSCVLTVCDNFGTSSLHHWECQEKLKRETMKKTHCDLDSNTDCTHMYSSIASPPSQTVPSVSDKLFVLLTWKNVILFEKNWPWNFPGSQGCQCALFFFKYNKQARESHNEVMCQIHWMQRWRLEIS